MLEHQETYVSKIPPDGISYIIAAVVWNLPLKEAICVLNQLVLDTVLRYDRHEKGHAVWVKDTVDPLDEALRPAKELTCVVCGKKFPAPKFGAHKRIYCSGDCKDKMRAPKTRKAKCKNCGQPFVSKSYKKGKYTRYCSTKCVVQSQHKNKAKKKPEVKSIWKPCIICGIDHNGIGDTCGRDCRNEALT